jgi:hypothetical protein
MKEIPILFSTMMVQANMEDHQRDEQAISEVTKSS